jgi:putative FmdB family regulatory protein
MVYDYECAACGAEMEIEHSIKESPRVECPVCGKEDGLKRLISLGEGFLLRGSGWYRDGYEKKEEGSLEG